MPRIDIYTTPWCGYCARAKQLLKQKGVKFTEIDVMTSIGKRKQMMARAGGAHSVPQIFIGKTHVGGCDQLMALERAGKLDAMLAD